jgi:hypothetical protein
MPVFFLFPRAITHQIDSSTQTHTPTHPPAQDYGIILNGLAQLGVQPEETVPGFLDRLQSLALPQLPRFNDQ